MTLYPPTHAEIDRLLQRATRNWPHLAKRIDNAAALLRPLALAWSQTRGAWLAHSQSDPTGATSYAIGAAGCSCLDYIHANGNRAGGRIFCKHNIAFHAYRRILLDHLHALYVGEAYSDEYRRIKQGYPLIAQVRSTPRLIGPTLDGVPLDIRYRYSPATRGRDFAGDADMARFAQWLPLALAERERIRADLEPAPQIWPPAGKLTPELIMAYDADQLPYEEWRALYIQDP